MAIAFKRDICQVNNQLRWTIEVDDRIVYADATESGIVMWVQESDGRQVTDPTVLLAVGRVVSKRKPQKPKRQATRRYADD